MIETVTAALEKLGIASDFAAVSMRRFGESLPRWRRVTTARLRRLMKAGSKTKRMSAYAELHKRRG